MRVLGTSSAGAGHLAPLLPVLRALADAGHDVTLAIPASGVPRPGVTAGITVASMPDWSEEEAAEGHGLIERLLTQRRSGGLGIRDDLEFIRHVHGRLNGGSMLRGLVPLVRQQHEPFGLVVHEPAEPAGAIVAEMLECPEVVASCILTDVLPEVADALCDGTADLRLGLGLPARSQLEPELILTPMPEVIERSVPGLPVRRWRTPAPAADPALRDDPAVKAALASGRPLVYATVGTIVGAIPPLAMRFAGALFEAMAAVDAECLFTTGTSADRAAFGDPPPNVHLASFLPQRAALAHAAAVVDHGGFNTVVDALAAGLPQVVVPMQSADQAEHGRRVQEIGAGVALEGEALTPRALAGAITDMLREDTPRAAAQAAAQDIAAAPWPSDLVGELEGLVAG